MNKKNENLFFNPEEISEMEKRTVDRIIEAIEAKDYDKAKRLTHRMYNEFLSMHDLYRNWVTSLLTEIGNRYGDHDLESIMSESCKSWWRPIRLKMKQSSSELKTQIKMFISGLHGHLQPLEISEDMEKVTIKLKPCGSGGRLVQEGRYKGKNPFLTIKKGQKITYNRTNFPVYCAHEAAMENVDFEDEGRPFVVVEPADKIGKDYCSFICYKKETSVPKKYYERLGFKKPIRNTER